MRFVDDAYGDDPEYLDAHQEWFVPDERDINRPLSGAFLFPSLDGEGEEE